MNNENATQNLIQAVTDNNVDAVRAAIQEGADVNTYADFPNPNAAYNGWSDHNGGTIHIPQTYSTTVLDYADERGHEEVVKALLEAKARPDTKANNGSPLKKAIQDNKTAVAKWLVEHGADIEEDSFPGTPLTIAAVTPNPELVRFLLEKDAKVKDDTLADALAPDIFYRKYHDGKECSDRLVPVIEMLTQAGADVNRYEKGKTALHKALSLTYSGFSPEDARAVIEAVINAGANLEAKDGRGETPIFYAAEHHLPDRLRLLIDHGAKADVKDGKGHSLLDRVRFDACNDCDKVYRDEKIELIEAALKKERMPKPARGKHAVPVYRSHADRVTINDDTGKSGEISL